MRFFSFQGTTLIGLIGAVSAASLHADELRVDPSSVELSGSRARQQFVATLKTSDGRERDVTREATWEVSSPEVVRIDAGAATPLSDGSTQLTVRFQNLQATARTDVVRSRESKPISFLLEAEMALTKAGCNMGACHGSPSGKGGFRLSLRAYDPDFDRMTLRTEHEGRRVNLLDPAESLLLRKPLMQTTHAGGQRLKTGDPAHRVLLQWITDGLPMEVKPEAELLRVEIFPAERVLYAPAAEQQLIVTGVFSDGSRRDLTELADFTSSNDSAARVSSLGLVSKNGRGESAVLARYLDKMATSRIAFLEESSDFSWPDVPQLNLVDRIIDDKLKLLQIAPSGLCADDEFLRRATLDVAGRLPTIAESEAFLADSAPDKRASLVERLLASDDYANYWALKWGDVLRSNGKKLKVAGVHKFRRWLFESIRDDKPLDQLARELLTASGSVYENPAANYWRISRDPQDAAETTSQLFMGLRMQCAKCHNHPFEKWTQDHYYGIAAAFVRVGRKATADVEEEVIFTPAGGEITQPRTGKTMPVHLLLQGDATIGPEDDRRVVFARWLTSSENPFFARAVVNRIWGHLLGRGIVDPIDDFRDSNPASHPALLDELARRFVSEGFRQKAAIRLITASRTYQASSIATPSNTSDEVYFSHATARLLAAEQLLDGICAVTGVPETYPSAPAGARAMELAEPPDHPFLKAFGQPQRELACQCERSTESSLSQALQMINGSVVHDKLRSDQGFVAKSIAAGRSDAEILNLLYRTAYSRRPSEGEIRLAASHIQAVGDRRQALEDVAWTVLNSKEFLFQH